MGDPKDDPARGSGSINEPAAGPAPPDHPHPDDVQAQKTEREPLPSDNELHSLTRAELDELAEQRGVDISAANNKQDVIDALKKDARKRK